ncbi:MAG TPA: hypothetical protein VN577_03020 [Terriglobales bacterium]|nr:hypothetical protein [Terriglobales bacterium]
MRSRTLNSMTRVSHSRFVLLVALVFGATAALFAQDYKTDPRSLVRRAIENETREPAKKEYFLFRDNKRNKYGQLHTREMVQTPDLVLARLVAIDGKPLNQEQRTKEDARLNRLINDPEELAKKRKEQREDDQRVRRMVKAMPEAFNYEYVGNEPTKNGELVVLKFSPNPNWNPPNRELAVFTGMAGTMKIALPQTRLALMQAQLFKNVDFGWGILGHLDKGGDFMIEQGETYPGHWDLTRMKLHFTGKVLIFKSLNIFSDEQMSNFHPVPPMNVAQALDKLKQVETEYAQNAAGGSK